VGRRLLSGGRGVIEAMNLGVRGNCRECALVAVPSI
jgi:hypothetical protein